MRFKKLKTILLSSVMALSVGCAKTEIAGEVEDKKVITLVLDKGGVNDQSFNQSAWKGALKASEELNVEVKYLESNTDSDYIANIETAIENSDLIIGVGFNLSEPIRQSAENYPNQQFAIIDGSYEEIPTNITPILFDEEGAGYLAGLAAAGTLKDTKEYGLIGGFEIPAIVNYANGFEKGIKEVNKDNKLHIQYANSFSDSAKGKAIANQMLNNGIECIMAAAGGVNNGAYEACKEAKKYAIGVDMEQSYIDPNTIITSAIKRVDIGVYKTIEELVNGSLKGGEASIYDMTNGGVDCEITNMLSKEAIEKVNSIKENLK